jgi:hypothetical protein
MNAYRTSVEKPEENRRLGRPRNERIISKWIKVEIGLCSMDWIDVAQDRDKWRGLVNTVMNLRVPKMLGNSGVAERLVAYL